MFLPLQICLASILNDNHTFESYFVCMIPTEDIVSLNVEAKTPRRKDTGLFLYLRVESMNSSLYLCRHGPLFKLKLSRVHHRSEKDRHIVKYKTHIKICVMTSQSVTHTHTHTTHRRTDRLFAPMSWQPCWIPAIR